MEVISLKTFAEKGLFGKIKVGSTKEEVIALLGTDYDFGDFNDSYILRYGCYEFFFWTESNELFAIQNDSLSEMVNDDEDAFLFSNKKFRIDPWFFEIGKKITWQKVIEILQDQNMVFTIETGELNKIEFESGVYLDFIDEYSFVDPKTEEWETQKIDELDDYLLNGIRLFDFG